MATKKEQCAIHELRLDQIDFNLKELKTDFKDYKTQSRELLIKGFFWLASLVVGSTGIQHCSVAAVNAEGMKKINDIEYRISKKSKIGVYAEETAIAREMDTMANKPKLKEIKK